MGTNERNEIEREDVNGETRSEQLERKINVLINELLHLNKDYKVVLYHCSDEEYSDWGHKRSKSKTQLFLTDTY